MKRALLFVGAVAGAVGCSDFATAPDRQPAELRLSPDTILLNQGDTVAFELTVLDQDGRVYDALPGWAPPHWTSSAPFLFELTPAGVGRSLLAGESRALVDLAGLQARAVVRANPLELDVGTAFVYLTQSVQRREGDVPLVAGRDGLLRVYIAGGGPNFFEPRVHATFHRDGVEVHSAPMEPEVPSIPVAVDEGELKFSYDAAIPGSVLQPGTGLVIEVDPDGRVPASASSELRVPAAGVLALDVRRVPPFQLRLVPVHQSSSGLQSRLDSSRMDAVTGLADDVFPFGEFDVDVRTPYTTTARLDTDEGWYDLIAEIAMLRLDDHSPRYYYGGFDRPTGTSILGLGYVAYPVSIGDDLRDETVAHEIGHNLNLLHAPCGGPSGPDPRFPYPDGTVGHYGWNRERERLMPPETYDLMSYCDPTWISDYNYERVMEYRDTSAYDAAFEEAATGRVLTPERDVLVVQGGVHDGVLRLRPALSLTAPPRLPTGGRYTLEGLDAGGAVVFAVSLEPRPLDHGGSAFLVALPEATAQPARLAVLRLRGPEGMVERRRSAGRAAAPPELVLEGDPRAVFPEGRWDGAAYPLAVIRDRATGRIVAMGRAGRLGLPASDPGGLDVVLSDGIESHPARLVRR